MVKGIHIHPKDPFDKSVQCGLRDRVVKISTRREKRGRRRKRNRLRVSVRLLCI